MKENSIHEGFGVAFRLIATSIIIRLGGDYILDEIPVKTWDTLFVFCNILALVILGVTYYEIYRNKKPPPDEK